MNIQKGKVFLGFARSIYPKLIILVLFVLGGEYKASVFSLDIIGTLNYVQALLMHIGPMLSAVLFIVAGIFYALGQMLPPDKKANFHTASINIIIGAVIVAVLSVASNGLAIASTHLLSNLTINMTK
ncbi:MAG: hypothetical protein ACP5K9_00830 [Candidatus Micrarchaeia archaeon]